MSSVLDEKRKNEKREDQFLPKEKTPLTSKLKAKDGFWVDSFLTAPQKLEPGISSIKLAPKERRELKAEH